MLALFVEQGGAYDLITLQVKGPRERGAEHINKQALENPTSWLVLLTGNTRDDEIPSNTYKFAGKIIEFGGRRVCGIVQVGGKPADHGTITTATIRHGLFPPSSRRNRKEGISERTMPCYCSPTEEYRKAVHPQSPTEENRSKSQNIRGTLAELTNKSTPLGS
ncbi:hypothetical protein BDR04DRAFT_1142659 [Suillus decipiens]|nr:hypothetical protein BDR04DRAFT_1142659 [Suillus decipiens]